MALGGNLSLFVRDFFKPGQGSLAASVTPGRIAYRNRRKEGLDPFFLVTSLRGDFSS